MRLIELIRRAIDNPNRITPFFRKKITRSALSFNAKVQQMLRPNPCDVVDEDWDNLIILDGCRYDMFRKNNNIGGILESRISKGSESWEFLKENFEGRSLYNTIYVTANPHAPKLGDDTFYKTVNVLESDWNSHLETVLPEDLADTALQVSSSNPNKRLIAHFMQPHFPFIGPKGRKISHKGISSHNESSEDRKHVWSALEQGTFEGDVGLVKEAYRENLDVVLPIVSDLIHALSGRTVVTSDHGNLIGNWSWPIPVCGYGHPKGLPVTSLVKVPWLIVEDKSRKKIVPGDPVENQQPGSEVVSERLEDLGYV